MTDAIGYGILWHWCRVTPGAPDGERFARSFWQALFKMMMPVSVSLAWLSTAGCRVSQDNAGWILFLALAVCALVTFVPQRHNS